MGGRVQLKASARNFHADNRVANTRMDIINTLGFQRRLTGVQAEDSEQGYIP
jgi:hypothetical protein